MQSVVPLCTGLGALKITTALFFRPGGESTQKAGVRSDIVLPSLSNTEEFGEAAEPYALSGQTVPGLLNGGDGGEPSVWQPVTSDLVTQLQSKSQARVVQSKDFQDVENQLADARKNQGVVHLDEILKKQEENGTKGKDPDDVACEEAKKPTVQLKEALQILADYLGAERQRMIAQGAGAERDGLGPRWDGCDPIERKRGRRARSAGLSPRVRLRTSPSCGPSRSRRNDAGVADGYPSFRSVGAGRQGVGGAGQPLAQTLKAWRHDSNCGLAASRASSRQRNAAS